MKYLVTIKAEDYQTFQVEAENASAAEKKINDAIEDNSLWDAHRKDIAAQHEIEHEPWDIVSSLTQERGENSK